MSRSLFLLLAVPAAFACSSRAASSEQGAAAAGRASDSTPPAAAASGRADGNPADSCLHYEPETVHLSGTLQLVPEYGPPNYGETPAKDQRLKVPVLVLAKSINVCAQSGNQLDSQSFQDISRVQLIFPLGNKYEKMATDSVRVVGKLAQAISGHHYTDVVLNVDTIQQVHTGPGS
jgi:Domain of unknown function (DUF4431)